MPLPTSAALKNWIADGHAVPLVTLYDISVSDAVTLRLVEGNPTGSPITYAGNVYTPAAIRREALEQTIEGDLSTFQLSVSNVDGVAGGYIENNELDGRQVTITTVPLSTLDPADALVETHTIQEQAYNRQAATVTLGHTNLFKRKLPWLKYQRTRCLWGYERRFDWLDEENGCRYPSDEFRADTTQGFWVGGETNAEQVRRFGWRTLNALKVTAWDTNQTLFDEATIETSATDAGWNGTTFGAPYMYKRVAGDFDVWTRVLHRAWRAGGLMGILCQEALSGQDSWIYVARSRDDLVSDPDIRTASGVNGVDEAHVVVDEPTATFLRLRRVGDVFTSFYRAAEPATVAAYTAGWTQADQRTVAMDTEVRIGLFVGGGTSEEPLGANFDFLRFQAGGLATCLRTPEECRTHENIHRILAFQGIPRR